MIYIYIYIHISKWRVLLRLINVTLFCVFTSASTFSSIFLFSASICRVKQAIYRNIKININIIKYKPHGVYKSNDEIL